MAPTHGWSLLRCRFQDLGCNGKLVDIGLVRNIGLCNVGVAILSDVLSYARFTPQVLQVELHPYNTQENLCRYCREKEIFVTGFSPLGAGSYVELNMATSEQSALLEPVVKSIADAKGVSPAQVILKWGLSWWSSFQNYKDCTPEREY